MTLETSPTSEWPVEELESLGCCPVCQSSYRIKLYTDLTDRVFFCSPGAWTLYQCSDCHVAYLDPRPGAAFIYKAYETYYTHGQANDVELQTENFTGRTLEVLYNGYLNARFNLDLRPSARMGSFLIERVPALRAKADHEVRLLRRPPGGGHLLDVGCGNGQYLRQMKDWGWRVTGIDFDAKAVESCLASGIHATQTTLAQAEFADNSFDAITLNHVIEHLHNPIDTLKECFRILRPNGLLYLETPNILSTESLRFKQHWRGLEVPRHLIIFTPKALAEVCSTLGFKVRKIEGVMVPFALHRQSKTMAAGKDPRANPLSLQRKEKIKLLLEASRGVSDVDRAEIFMLLAVKPMK